MAAKTPPKAAKGITEPTRSAARDRLYHALIDGPEAGGGDDLPRREEAQVRPPVPLQRCHCGLRRSAAGFRLLPYRLERNALMRQPRQRYHHP